MRSLSLVVCLVGPLGLLLNVAAAASDPAVDACIACHGPAGVSADPHVPTIGGMSSFYLESAMYAYREGRRSCPEVAYPDKAAAGESKTTMCAAAKALDQTQLTRVANYYAEKKFVRAGAQKTDPGLVSRGKQLHQRHCHKCHTDNGAYADDDAGILAGQWMHYLAFTMEDFRAGTRPVMDKMQQPIQALSGEDIDALVHFYASQK